MALDPLAPTSPELEVGSTTLAAAAELLGVHYMTAYRYVRTGRMHAVKRGGKWWVDEAEILAVLAEGTGIRAKDLGKPEPRSVLVAGFTARLVAGDTAGCSDLIADALTAGATPVEVHEQFLRPALADVGLRWRRGELTIADEHRATATAQRLIGELSPLFRHRGRRRGTIVIGSVPGDPHSLPSSLLSDLLVDRRFDVIDLGANTPAESFVEAATSVDDLVGIGVCTLLADRVTAGIESLGTIRQALPNAFLVAGGPGFATADPSLLAGLVDVVTSSGPDACSAFESSLEETEPADTFYA